MHEGNIPAPGAPIYFRRFGQGSRALVVPNAAWLAADFRDLVQDRSVVFYDPRGRGKSGPVADKAQITLESEIEDLDCVVRHCGLELAVLFGWSYHGAVVANYASRHPETVLRMIQSGPLVPRRASYHDRATATLQSRWDSRAIMELLQAPPRDPVEGCKALGALTMPAYFFDPSARKRSLAQPCELENEQPRNVMPHVNAFLSSLGDWDFRPAAARYTGPVLIVHGDADWIPVDASREWQAAFPNARLLIAPSAGHLPWLEQPNLWFPWLHAFLGDADLNNWSWPTV
jgi:proline iminopeptidase